MRHLLTSTGLLAIALLAIGAGCGEPIACSDNSGCAPGDYCAKASGDCRGAGQCTDRPQACILLYDPVCGCDGKTYGNACEAAAAGVNVAARGACKVTCAVDKDCPAGQVCEDDTGCKKPMVCVPGCHADADCAMGQVCKRVQCVTCPCPGTCEARPACKSNADCPGKTDYCAKAAGDCGGGGACTAKPQACPENIDPVCGCDGKTYGNACEAAAAGVNVATRGACKVTCAVDKDCPAGQVCEDDTGCKKPMVCVAGCHVDADCALGQACERVKCLTCPCPGICKPRPACKSNQDCPANTHWCAKRFNDCSGAGACTVRPEVCPKNLDPMCGCDGKTYGNQCDASRAGVNVAAKGPCKMTCTVDRECPLGQVCELDTGCMKPMICVPGCHADADCGVNGKCNLRMCLTCPCPGSC